MNMIKYISKKEIQKKSKNKIHYLLLKAKRTVNNYQYLKIQEKKYGEVFGMIGGNKLDNEQKKAVLLEEDATLVVAGAGSGKTLTIIGRIKYLINCQNINPNEILCISFTNAITKELEESIYKELKIKIDVLTFHSLGMKILRSNNLYPKIVEENFLKSIIDSNLKEQEMLPLYKNKIKNLIETFINLFKSDNSKTFEQIKEEILKEKNKLLKDNQLKLLTTIEKIYQIYEESMTKNGLIDFNDMLNEATKLIEEKYECPHYKYIIIDEFQDTSKSRYDLIKAIKNKNNSKLLAVGDDWQSIYRFTGCDVEIFTKFSEYFESSHITKITTTYRNPQELIDAAGNFIMKNPYQLKKILHSKKSMNRPIKIYFYNKLEEFNELLKKIPKERKNILVIGRNNEDKKMINMSNNMKFMTAHKSKGLQSDTAIIINLIDDIKGFPNKITDDPIFRHILKKDIYHLEEERRLFYVALTRTKNEVFLFVPYNNKSIFVDELIKTSSSEIEIISKNNTCPICHNLYDSNNKCIYCKLKSMI